MKCKAKMAAHGRQFYKSVLVSYAVLYVKFSLPHHILRIPEVFFFENTHKMFL